MSRAFLFDIGNVILRFDFRPAAERLAARSNISPDEVLVRLADFKNALESGTISDDDFIAQSCGRIGFRGTPDEFAEIWSDIFSENAPMIPLVSRLAGEHPLYLFSNTSGLHKNWFMKHFDVFSRFQGGVFSHEVRCMKPDEAFYRAAIRQFALDPARTFYIDDLAENIAAGAQFGFATHHYDPGQHPALEARVGRWLAAT